MIISTKGRYALRVMIDLAQHQNGNYIPLKDIAARQEISEKYLEAILKILVTENMLVGLRGKGGGYKLNKSPDQYTVWDILRVTEGGLVPVSCLEAGATDCPRSGQCETLPMWRDFNETVIAFFSKYTVADLAASPNEEFNYVI